MISIEVFAAKDDSGHVTALMVAVPLRCGLKGAEVLRVAGRRLSAIRRNVVMAVDLPDLDEQSHRALVEAARTQETIAVAEFNVVGVVDSYLLRLEVVS